MVGAVPDGICLDAEGAVWVASPVGGAVLRLLEGGEITHRIEVEHKAFACMLGVPERRTLFICTAAIFEEDGRTFLLYAIAGESGLAIAEVHLEQ